MLLTSPLAHELYQSVKNLPIIDYHTHLPAAEILHDQQFENIWELWLKHDHYKWRLMRACGVGEHLITGNAEPKEKFLAFAASLPLAIGNPVYQWAHMELNQVFGITKQLNANTAEAIWSEANQQLQSKISVSSLLKQFKVELIGTTDDPYDDLADHIDIKNSKISTAVVPTYRPDKYLLAESIDLTSLKERHDYFHASGCLMSDHGIDHIPTPGSPAYKALIEIAKWNHEKSWILQLHLGPLRRVNTRLSAQTGPDSGFDTMGSWSQTDLLIHFLNELDALDQLPKTVVYNLNPNESASLCCALQNFQQAPSAGKLQYGAAWWHLDNVPGIQAQLDLTTQLSAIGTHIGMLTDSRSFTSYVRHDYYRRILSSFLAEKAISGEMPNDKSLLSQTAQNISYYNVKEYLAPQPIHQSPPLTLIS
ncbi:glucuronate isomerase [Rubritalea spongiae]|uniref:Uronate isomerase n=1 Tax=Rubritalea spongiae TaxID=430797 RepID=A0ABW5E6Y1_9BACT